MPEIEIASGRPDHDAGRVAELMTRQRREKSSGGA